MTKDPRFNVVPQTEKCVVWQVGRNEMQGVVVECDAAKKVRIGKVLRRRRGEGMPKELLRIPNLTNIPVVVAFHPTVAYPVVVPFRKKFQKAEPKAHRLEFQAMVREILDRTGLELRDAAAERLGVEDLDAVLFDARVARLKIDGEDAPRNLPDLSGRELQGTLHVVFTARSVFHDLHDLLHSGKELFVTERGKAALAFLERGVAASGETLRLIDLTDEASELAVLTPKDELPLKVTGFPWSASVDRLFEELWRLPRAAALEVVARARAGTVSEDVRRLFERLAIESQETFDKALRKLRLAGKIYVRRGDRLSFMLPAKFGRASLEAFSLDYGLHALGFETVPADSNEDFLLPFLEYYFYRGDPTSHRALTRQIHWIKQ